MCDRSDLPGTHTDSLIFLLASFFLLLSLCIKGVEVCNLGLQQIFHSSWNFQLEHMCLCCLRWIYISAWLSVLSSHHQISLHIASECKEHILTAHSATVGQHSHFVTVMVIRQTEPVSEWTGFFSVCAEKKKNPEWGTADRNPAAPGSRVITECFGQGAEIAAAPLHSLTLSALHWLGTWARMTRSHLWQCSTHSLSSTFF